MPGTEMRVWFLSARGAEQIPAGFVLRRGWLAPDDVARLRERSAEVAPGVRVTVLGYGDSLLPDGKTLAGVRMLQWKETGTEKERDGVKFSVTFCSWCLREQHLGPGPAGVRACTSEGCECWCKSAE